jgi:inosose dehydratase
LEFDDLKGEPVGCIQMLDELTDTGYAGTELGDWGYFPTDPERLSQMLKDHNLVITGAFTPVAFADPDAHQAGVETALRNARLLHETAARLGQSITPYIVLADNNGSDPVRTQHAGRVTPEVMLSEAGAHTFASGVESAARAVREETGLPAAFHHHCGGFVETPDEIERLLTMTDPELVGLVLDTGHYVWGSGDSQGPNAALERFEDRIRYIHFKDCNPQVMAQTRAQDWDYFGAMNHGIFCELGQGCVDFPAVVDWLRRQEYDGFVTVEQDVLPGMGAPRESAARNRTYLRRLGV